MSQDRSSSTPKARRPRFPKEYGVATETKDLLPWSHVEDRLAAAKHYWVSSVGADGTPHARPIDGMWIDGRLYFGGSPKTRWLANVRMNPAVCIHLESGEDVVILHGIVENVVPDEPFARRLAEAATEKYGYSVPAETYQKGVCAFHARTVYAWTALPKDATRWDLEPET